MAVIELIGDILILISRISVIILAATSSILWTSLVVGIHFLLMLGCALLQQTTQKLNRVWLIKCFVTAVVKCFCNPFSRNEAKWNRCVFYLLVIGENVGLVSLFFIWSSYEQWMIISGSIIVCVLTFVGVFLREATTLQQINSSPKDEENPPEKKIEVETTLSALPPLEDTTSSVQESFNVTNEPLMDINKKRDTMCSIQDLLANTSVMKSVYNDDTVETDVACSTIDKSIHQVGLPLIQDRTPSPTVSQASSKAVSEVMRGTSSMNSSNYENIYDPVTTEDLSSHCSQLHQEPLLIHSSQLVPNCDSSAPQHYNSHLFQICNSYPLPPFNCTNNPCVLSESNRTNQSVATENSNDYENVLPTNVYRADTGVRHWKAYLDIEDNMHDYSTFKERSAIQDSTMASGLNSKGRSNAYSISLPDLSNIETVTYETHNNNKEDAEEEVVSPNYETIWYSDSKEDEFQPKESLCNLYYSSLADLSSKYFYEEARILSLDNQGTQNISKNKVVSTKPSLVQKNSVETSGQPETPIKPASRTNSLKRIQKSPIVKLMSLSHTCLQERTSKVLQVGKRVFYKPRIHEITPKKETLCHRRASHASRTRNIDPYVIRRRVDLSPKNRLILSEASTLIKHRNKNVPELQPRTPPTYKSLERRNDDPSDGPQHSTPESDRHLPQMSILSTISSVSSPPEETRRNNRTNSSCSLNFTLGKSLVSQQGKRCSSKQLQEMTVIKETSSASIHL